MKDVKILPRKDFGRAFIPTEFLPAGMDQHYLRNRQISKPAGYWRKLRADEIEVLVKNVNTCDDWADIHVHDPFLPQLVKNCEFAGQVRIGRLENVVLEHHDLEVPCGITDSRIISCDIGDNAAIRNVHHLAHYIIGDNVILLNINEMHTTNHAKFGNGIVKDGEPEEVRVWIDVVNETGGRAVLPFDGMTPADACIWATYREDTDLQKRLVQITQCQFDPRRGFYGTVGDACVVKNCRILKDVKIGPCCYIKGANKLKNLTINSSEEEPTQIGEGVELVNGIIGLGCHIFYGAKAVRFVMCNNSNLKYGARLIHSVLGDNSTVSCCELLNNLIFPAHEQHHNNSFLTASLVLGQSNLAAGATIGSNHNSRANDGEIRAGRGFWPGLCTTLKHNCRFASFVLLSKGDYPAELNIPLPFALLNDDRTNDRLLVMPAFWWRHNMYALARNTWKFQTRDKRKTRTQNIEFDCLAPDTVEEIFTALRLLEIWTARASPRGNGQPPENASDDSLAKKGCELLLSDQTATDGLEVLGENMEDSRRKQVILKPREGYMAYRQMLHYYAMKNLFDYMATVPDATLASMCRELAGTREKSWINLGGQLAPEQDVQRLLAEIKSGRLGSWPEIHAAYDALWAAYPRAKQKHAYATLLCLLGIPTLTPEIWNAHLDEAIRDQEYVRDQVYISRKKDYENPFRRMTFRNPQEMKAVVGTAEDNSFVKQVRRDTEAFRELVESVRKRG
jgi:NDP-sugar pyrophosphorylase family protein